LWLQAERGDCGGEKCTDLGSPVRGGIWRALAIVVRRRANLLQVALNSVSISLHSSIRKTNIATGARTAPLPHIWMNGAHLRIGIHTSIVGNAYLNGAAEGLASLGVTRCKSFGAESGRRVGRASPMCV